MRLSKIVILLLILTAPVYAGEICRIYPGGGGDGVGDISVSRASSATGISLLGEIQTWGSNLPTFRDGRVQSLPTSGYTNLLEYSEDFALWTASNISLSANLVGPDNQTNSGYTATATAGNGTLKYTSTTTTSQDYNYSIWMRRITGTGNIDLTLDNGSTWTTQTLSSDWQRFDITQSLASPVVGIRIVTDTDAIGIFGAQETATVYQLPYIPTSGSTVSVAGETKTADISTNAALRDALSDTDSYDTDGESIFTMLAVWKPHYDNPNSVHAIITCSTLLDGRLFGVSSYSDRFFCNSSSATYSPTDVFGDDAETLYWYMVTADSTADSGNGELQVCASDDEGANWSCGSVTTYDGAFSVGNDLIFGYNNKYPSDIGPVIFYDEVLTTAQAATALAQNQKAAGMAAAAVPSFGSEQETPQKYGYSTVGSTVAATTSSRCMPFTTGPGNFTATHFYFYGRTSDGGTDGTFQGYIMTDDSGSPGVQVGDCTPSTDIIDGTASGWNEAVWDSYLALSPNTNYWVCGVWDEGIRQHFDTGDLGDSYYESAPVVCGDDATETSTRQVSMVLSNYDVY